MTCHGRKSLAKNKFCNRVSPVSQHARLKRNAATSNVTITHVEKSAVKKCALSFRSVVIITSGQTKADNDGMSVTAQHRFKSSRTLSVFYITVYNDHSPGVLITICVSYCSEVTRVR